ncbi:hypothetical protein NBRC116585_06230 [Thalassolituus maritimus]|uniref:Uncharacterized protein n=1 Tax=Thalassolituus maritimus TaxID=484498 RepID=A0ABP9ZWJ8_9GAMM
MRDTKRPQTFINNSEKLLQSDSEKGLRDKTWQPLSVGRITLRRHPVLLVRDARYD